jgi:hypothetical protein
MPDLVPVEGNPFDEPTQAMQQGQSEQSRLVKEVGSGIYDPMTLPHDVYAGQVQRAAKSKPIAARRTTLRSLIAARSARARAAEIARLRAE